MQTEYTHICFEKRITGNAIHPDRWICKARLRAEVRIGYIEYSEQFQRFVYVQDKAVVDSRYLREIMLFMNELIKERRK
jgi:hypothetical protein